MIEYLLILLIVIKVNIKKHKKYYSRYLYWLTKKKHEKDCIQN